MNIKEYSEISSVIASNTMGFTNSISRGNAIPLDQSSIFESLAAAKTYVNDAGIAYEGQIIAVKEGNFQNVYVLDKSAPDGLRKLASDSSSQASFSCTISALETATDGALKSYQLYQGGVPVDGAVIDIPKDYLVKKAEIKVCKTNDTPLAGLKVGDKYLDFVVNSKDSAGEDGTHLYINLHDLTDVYTGGETSTIKVTVADDNTITANIVNGSIHYGLLSTDVTAKFDGLRTDVNTLTTNLANEITRATDAEKAIAANLKTVTDDYLKSSDKTALENAINTAKSEASTAVTNLRDELYTGADGLSAKLHKEVTDAAATAKSNSDQALKDAKAYTDEVSATLSTDYVGKINNVSDQLTALNSGLSAYLKKEVANSPTTDDKLMKRSEVEAKINALDVTVIRPLASQTISMIGEEDGKLCVAIQDIEINQSHVTGLTDDLHKINTTIDGLKSISASHDGKIKNLETSVGTLTADANTDGSVKNQIKAEADRAKEAESALAKTLSAVSSDYLKAEDRTNLQGKIDTINNALSGTGGYNSRITANENAISTLNGGENVEGSVAKKIKDSLAGLANAMHFRGVVTRADSEDDKTAIAAKITNPKEGDVVVVTNSSKEYVYDGKQWVELGDETLYATNAKLNEEVEARKAADKALSDKIDVLNGEGNGSVSKAVADALLSAKTYTNGISAALSGDYVEKIGGEATRAGNVEKFLSSAVDSKVLIDGLSATQLKVSHISDVDFHQKVVDGSLLSNEIYVVSSENINAFDQRITNVKAPELSSDAATKNYVDETVKATQNKLDELSTYTHALSVSQLVWDIDVINCGTSK